MKTSAIGALGVLMVCVSAVCAQDKAPQPPPAAAVKVQPSIRVTFKLMPMDANEKDVFVVSNGEFSTSREWKGDGSSFALEITGALELQPDGRLVMTFKAALHGEGPDGTGDFRVSTHLLLAPGKELEVARLGDKTLVVNFSPQQ